MMRTLLLSFVANLIALWGIAGPINPDTQNQPCFYENKGQVVDQQGKKRTDIDFVLYAKGMTIFIGSGKIEYQFAQIGNEVQTLKLSRLTPPGPVRAEMYRVDMTLVNADKNAGIVRENKQQGVANFVDADSKSDMSVVSFGKITYKNIYPGIDWVIYVRSGTLKYEFIVHPGATVSDIQIKYDGATNLHIEDGNLIITAPPGVIKESRPISFQEDSSFVASSFVLADDLVSFTVPSYKGILTIDPAVVWSTYLGGPGHERYTDIIPDSSGHIYACGYTSSLINVATTGAHQTSLGGGFDGLISKFDTSGALIWSTYYGGTTMQYLFAISTADTNIYAAGETVNNNDHDVLLVKFNHQGQWIWTNTYGSYGFDQAEVVINDPWGNIYVAGTTESAGMATSGAFQTTQGQNGDAFLMKVDPSGNTIWSTYYGDVGFDEFDDLQFDNTGNIIGVGGSMSSGLNTMSPSYAGGLDALLFSFDTSGARLWCRYFGSSGGDYAYALDLDAAGNIFITGSTNSTSGITSGTNPYQSAMTGFPVTDAYLAKFDNTGQTLWATYFGGSGFDIASSLEVTSGGDVVFGGNTVSISGIASGTAIQPVYGGGSQDGFLAKFSGAGTYLWSTYFGGNDFDYIYSVALDALDEIYVAGYTESNNAISTTLSYQPAYNANGDAFLTKFTDCTPVAASSPISGPVNLCAGETAVYSIPPVTGATAYSWTIPSGFTGNSNTNTINITAGNASGTLSVIASNSCSSTPANTLAITVNTPGTAAIAPVSNPVICQGDSIILQTAVTAVTYQWLFNGNPIAGSTNDTLHVLSQGNYSLIINPGSLCPDTSAIVAISVNPPPLTPGPIAGNQTVCQDSLQIYTVPGVPMVTSYLWTLPAGWTGVSNTNSITVTPGVSAGILSVAAANNCGQSAPQSVAVASSPAPLVAINASGSWLTASNTFNTYQWYHNGNIIPGATNQNYNWTVAGAYYVVVFDGVCSARSDTLTLPLTGLETMLPAGELAIFPNPNNGSFIVRLPLEHSNPVVLEIFNLHGQLVYSRNVFITDPQSGFAIQANNIPAGIYMLKVQTKNLHFTRPFVID